MKIWTDISSFSAKKACLTIGSFDGVHLGHLKVLTQLQDMAESVGGESVVFTFDPHPAMVLNPEHKINLLTTVNEKIQQLEKAGIDHLILYPFTKEFSSLSHESFVKQILVAQLNLHSLLIGYDNTIGKNKEGNFSEINKLAKRYRFTVNEQTALKVNETAISSTLIRELLSAGKLFEASKLLGYPYIVSGRVIHGKQLGNKLGFPTANILPEPNKFTPAIGVYIVQVLFENKSYEGMMNIGLRPTVNSSDKTTIMEVNLFNFEGDLYDKFLQISILKKIRNEQKFESVEALRLQIKKDRLVAQNWFQEEFNP